MTESKKDKDHKPLTLSSGSSGRLSLKKPVETGQVRQSFSHGRSKVVQVERRKKRNVHPHDGTHAAPEAAPAAESRPAPKPAESRSAPKSAENAPAQSDAAAAAVPSAEPQATAAPATASGRGGERAGGGAPGGGNRGGSRPPRGERSDRGDRRQGKGGGGKGGGRPAGGLTATEKDARMRALEGARRRQVEEEARRKAEEEARRLQAEEDAKRQAEEAAARAEQERLKAERRAAEPDPAPEAPAAEEAPAAAEAAPAGSAEASAAESARKPAARDTTRPAESAPARPARTATEDEEAEKGKAKGGAKKAAVAPRRGEPKRRQSRLSVTSALDDSSESRGRSLAATRRARERQKQKANAAQDRQHKIVREVILPEVITVQELANRMAERSGQVIKTLMKLGIMATINQSIDADTAELVVAEFGHMVKRVSDADVEEGLQGQEDQTEDLKARAPVVTIMGHVDHGKTSLLDALRETDVVAGEAGGITQHIGAYQVTLESGAQITFIDTPGHEAFTQMRSRGAKVTDLVVLVVAADDGVMPQTVEAIRHAHAAEVPLIVAVNKMDKPDADPSRVRQELLQYEVVVEDMGGEVLSVDVSAKQRQNLGKLEEAILLVSEIAELKANPNRAAQGVVVEARMERGRGPVATVLVQRGTLRSGDVFVAGQEWGRVRALLDDRGNLVEEAGPSQPVEVLGLNAVPQAGDEFLVVEDEGRAREVSDFRQSKARENRMTAAARGTVEQMFSQIAAGEARELPVVIKGDVQGSVEALVGTLEKLGTEEVRVRVLHSAVGGINESDITLAKASNALVIGFNVRANPQAREMARREHVDIRYYSIIYDVADDLKKALTGMMEPTFREKFLGYAEIRQVFSISKVGKVAGCMVTEGVVRRGAGVRLLRDHVVIHEGKLGQLKRFKDDVREVKDGYECGMSFESYNDIQERDVIECYEVEQVAPEL